MERSRAPVAPDRFAPYRSAGRPRARQHPRPSAAIGGGEMSCGPRSKVYQACRAGKVTDWKSRDERYCPPTPCPGASARPPPDARAALLLDLERGREVDGSFEFILAAGCPHEPVFTELRYLDHRDGQTAIRLLHDSKPDFVLVDQVRLRLRHHHQFLKKIGGIDRSCLRVDQLNRAFDVPELAVEHGNRLVDRSKLPVSQQQHHQIRTEGYAGPHRET